MYAILGVTFIICILLFLALSGRGGEERFLDLNKYSYAHRGLHNKQGIPENSLLAFELAVEKGYGIELDVHLLAGGGLAVFHDDSLKRVTGKEGRIRELKVEQLKKYTLNGTDLTIPEFGEVLKLVNGRVPILIELKTHGDSSRLCREVLKSLENYRGIYCIESFNSRPLIWLRKNAPNITRGLLSKDFIKKPGGRPFALGRIITAMFLNFLTKPDFIAYKFEERNNLFNRICVKIWGLKSFVWTITSKEDFDIASQEGCISIFEQFEP